MLSESLDVCAWRRLVSQDQVPGEYGRLLPQVGKLLHLRPGVGEFGEQSSVRRFRLIGIGVFGSEAEEAFE